MTAVDRADYSTTRFWDHLVQRGNAIETIHELIDREGMAGDALALAHGALGRCLFEAGRLAEAHQSAEAALAAAERGSDEVRLWVAMGASYVLAEAGRIDEALDRLRSLAAGSEGVALGRMHVQIATVLHHAGRLTESIAEFDRGHRLLADHADAAERARLHNNRGVVLLQAGRLDEADADFRAAAQVAAAGELWAAQAQSVANRAVLLGRSRRLAEAVAEFDRAAELFERAGDPARPVAIMSIDQAEVMMHSGLHVEAVAAGHAAVDRIRETGNSVLLGDALLVTARAELASGDRRAATATAALAARTFVESDRLDMVAHARSVEVTAVLEGAPTAADASEHLGVALALVDSMRAAGWDDLADSLSLVRVRVANRWRRDDAMLTESVRADLERLRAGAIDDRRDSALAGRWAEAVACTWAGDTEAASEACHGGLEILDHVVAEAPTLEARSAAMKLGSDLSRLLIELAVADGDVETAFGAAEGTRARSLHEELADPDRHRPLTRAGAVQLCADLIDRLDARSLVEWIVVGDEVWAVVLDRSGSRLVRVGGYDEIVLARDRAVVWIDRAAEDPDASSSRARRSATLLDELLVAPLELAGDDGVVIVPVDLLHGIPWSGLPSLAGRPLTLVPNAQLWLAADRRAGDPVADVGLVIGAEIEGSEIERAAIELRHPDAVVADGSDASGSTVATMLAATGLVHVSAHGTFRSDHPLLSTLRLVDGEISLHDAVPPRVHARLVILSSCEGGAQGTADGSEVLGLSSVLLARGAAAVLAPLTIVRELECAEFVAEVHAELAAGESFASAVAAVRRRWLADDDLSRWAVASSFTCFGSGAVRVAG